MKYAKLENSERLQRVNNLLSDGKPHTTRDIIRKAHVCAVNSIIGELRLNGIEIQCQQKGRKWYYWKPSKQTKPVKQTLSPWFAKYIKPHRNGLYEVRRPDRDIEWAWYDRRVGWGWAWMFKIDAILYKSPKGAIQDKEWRGIVK